MMKKTLAILSVFAVLFGFTACKNGLEGNLEGNTTDALTTAIPTVNFGETELFIDDGNGNTVPVAAVTDKNGNTLYEYTDANGNKVTEKDKNNLVGVTKYSKEEQAQIFIEQVSKEFGSNPDSIYDSAEEVEFILADGLVPEESLTKVDVKLDENGNPDRGSSKSYQDIISGNAFTVKMNIKSVKGGIESDIPLSWVKSGDSFLIETNMPIDGSDNSVKASILYADKKCYMIFPSMKFYAEIPAETFQELFDPEIFEEDMAENTVYDSSYETKINGKTYYCDVYKSEDGKTTTKNYFDNKGNPIRVEIITDNDVTIWEITQVSSKADTSVLKLPAGYFDISAIYGEEIDWGF